MNALTQHSTRNFRVKMNVSIDSSKNVDEIKERIEDALMGLSDIAYQDSPVATFSVAKINAANVEMEE